MKIVNQMESHLNRDVMFISYKSVADDLQRIDNILSESVKNRLILKLTRPEIEDFLADIAHKVHACYLECLQLRCH